MLCNLILGHVLNVDELIIILNQNEFKYILCIKQKSENFSHTDYFIKFYDEIK